MDTNEAISGLFNLLLANTAWANIGDAGGLQPSVGAGHLFISFHTAWPGNTGNQTTNEAAYAGYGTRPGITRAGGQWTISSPTAENVNQVAFPQCSSGSEVEMFIGIGTAATGTGHLLRSGPITTAFYGCTGATSGNLITVPGSTFSVNDRIAFFEISSDIPLPTGITEGQVYFVKTASGETVTVSATSGGAVVVITASGSGISCKVQPFTITALATPTLDVNQLVLLQR